MPPKICPHDDTTCYKGHDFACYCKLIKPGKIVSIDIDKLDSVCPLRKNAPIKTDRTA